MLEFSNTGLDKLVIHQIGNKNNEEGVIFSKEEIHITEDVTRELLMKYFLSSFRKEMFFSFSSEVEESGLVCDSVSKIFDDTESILDQSVSIADHLYEQSNHPKIAGGELFVVYFTDCIVDGEQCDAVGLFKSEIKDSFLKVLPKDGKFGITHENGIDIRKPDKGCLIFNTEKELGYKACIIDNISRGDEAHYWKEDFLSMKAREDNFYYTVNQLKMCKGFVEEAFGDDVNFSKPDKIDILNRSVQYFNDNELFTSESFNQEVIEKPELIHAFNDYKQQYIAENNLKAEDQFEISKPAFKGAKKYLRSVLKLDKNFHVYIHGKREYIEKGYDEDKGLHFYQLFFEEES